MLFRSNKPIKDGLLEAKYQGDNFKIVHVQNVDHVALEAKKMRDNLINKGWGPEKEWKLIGHIPAIEYLNHPEWEHDPKAIVKWLKTEYGSRYLISRP